MAIFVRKPQAHLAQAHLELSDISLSPRKSNPCRPSKLENKTVCTSFSLNAHGSEEAWQKAVEAYARHKSIHKNSKLYQRLLKAKPNVAS